MNWSNYLLLGFILLASLCASRGLDTTAPATNGTEAAAEHSTQSPVSESVNGTVNVTEQTTAQANNSSSGNGTENAGTATTEQPLAAQNTTSSDAASPEESATVNETATAPPGGDGNTTDSGDQTSVTKTPEPILVTNHTGVTMTPESTLVTNKMEDITTAGSTSSTSTEKPSSLTHTVKISETNLLLVNETDADSLFIELQGKPGEDLTGLWLTVHNAGMNTSQDALLLKVRLESNVNSNGIHLMDKNTGLDFKNKLTGVQAVFIGLYEKKNQMDNLDTDGLLDLLLYSAQGSLERGLQEKFAPVTQFPLILDLNQFPQQDKISLSRCSMESSNAGFLLAPVTSGNENVCTLSTSHNLEMWLSLQKQLCPDQLSHSFQDDLIRKIITEVNGLKRCGLSRLMLSDMQVSKSCISKDETRVDVKFTVKAALRSQLPLVVQGYESFVRDPNHNLLHLTDGDYVMHNCSKLCSAPVVKPSSDSEKKTQVTVGVVLACVGVFILVLLVVIMYMKKKRRGILQFRMTRLDEEDDDIIGDMDDFVGNQGPTFRSFR